MTSADPRPSVPHQAPPPGAPQPGSTTTTRRRLVTLLVVVLLIGIPTGYLVVSAQQSRDSGKDKARKAAATGLTADWPSRVQRRIYDVPIPRYSKNVAFYETNTWKVSRLYVQFTTTDEGLDTFLHNIGTSRSDLRKDRQAVTERNAAVVGWNIGSGSRWAGTAHPQPDPQPDHRIAVDLGNPSHPTVYVVSTATP
ncbi:sugar kinase [Streptomyces meridianus]|uniref:Sugar kinase n=1 Tax=Streptomyces meridianus TaxID=2938945 RepID=A0ABT0X2B3_9ACTN|nr:sugar kinase [Streptomyces meridianus]MCM2576672.1 sugar kinase [Streptomyces meridianus]